MVIGSFKMAERINWEEELFRDDATEEGSNNSENESDDAQVG